MGNTIGDYVHYRANNYLKYGINRTGTGIFDAGKAISQQWQNMATLIEQTKQGGMEDNEKALLIRRLQFLMRPSGDNGAYREGEGSAAEYEWLWEILQPVLKDEFHSAADRVQRALANIEALIPSVDNFQKLNPQKGHMYASTINTRLKAIQNAVDKCLTDPSNAGFVNGKGDFVRYTKRQREALIAFHTQLMKEKDALGETISKLLDPAQLDIVKKRSNQDTQLALDKSLLHFINYINSLATLGRGSANQYKGTLFEFMVVAAANIGRNLTYAELQDAVLAGLGKTTINNTSTTSTGQWTGKMVSPVVYSEADFGNGKINMKSVLTSVDSKTGKAASNYQNKVGDLWVSTNPTQNKVDVRIQLDPEKNVLHNLSIKNKAITGAQPTNIDIVSDTPLLAVLASLRNHELVNHYLNQHVPHNTTVYSGYLNNIFDETSRVVMLSVIERAFRGYKGPDKADVFVVNDNISGIVKIYNIGDILIELNNMDINMLSKYVEIRPDLRNIIFDNTYSENGAWDRITKLLASVHTTKVFVGLHPYLVGRDFGNAYVGPTL